MNIEQEIKELELAMKQYAGMSPDYKADLGFLSSFLRDKEQCGEISRRFFPWLVKIIKQQQSEIERLEKNQFEPYADRIIPNIEKAKLRAKCKRYEDALRNVQGIAIDIVHGDVTRSEGGKDILAIIQQALQENE